MRHVPLGAPDLDHNRTLGEAGREWCAARSELALRIGRLNRARGKLATRSARRDCEGRTDVPARLLGRVCDPAVRVWLRWACLEVRTTAASQQNRHRKHVEALRSTRGEVLPSEATHSCARRNGPRIGLEHKLDDNCTVSIAAVHLMVETKLLASSILSSTSRVAAPGLPQSLAARVRAIRRT